MAISVKEISLNHSTKTANVSLFADTKEEVTDNITVDGVPNDYTLELGSSVMTTNGELAFRKSDGTWNWLG